MRASGVQETSAPAPPSLDSVPALLVTREELEWFDLDGMTRAVLALVDGLTSVEGIIAVADEPVEVVLQALCELEREGIIEY